MAVVETKNLTKKFDDVVAVDDLTIATEEGEYLVLLGPSGCGKTTLLRLIAGLEQPTSGEIFIGGNRVAGLPPRARKIAMVFQSYALYPQKTAFDNIAFPLKASSVDSAQRREKVEWAAELLGITHLLKRKPRQLSGGERQRVALARALVREPSVFLLDEPLSNLDAKLRASAREDLKDFQRRVEVTTIYVTHDQVEAMGLGDRIAVMDGGNVRQIGTPVEIYQDPADVFVATFVGSPPTNLVERDRVVIGFRPENLRPKEMAPEEKVEEVTLHVTRIEYFGSQLQVVGTLEGLGEPTRVIAAVPARAADMVHEGEPNKFVIRKRDLRFFDKNSGKRTKEQRV
jgi:multiple sugar transport system ATP-binding protein